MWNLLPVPAKVLLPVDLRPVAVPCLVPSQALPGVIRTNSYCGVESASEFATCDVFVSCFEDSTTFYDWASCMEHSVGAQGPLLLLVMCNAIFFFHRVYK